MEKPDLKTLIIKYNAGECSEEEQALLESWYLRYEESGPGDLSAAARNADLRSIGESLPGYRPKVRRPFPWVAAAAVLLICLSFGIYTYLDQAPKNNPGQVSTIQNKVEPGENKAVLVLANGKKVNLMEAANGEIATQSGIVITKTREGQLVYTNPARADEKTKTDQVPFNEILTPNGGQYQLNLPDGTAVWLNAASSLKYPTYFSGRERKVELTGEAYFEVAKDKEMPFIVKTGRQEVRVLGTHFNINSYSNEKETKTTLLEGAVKVAGNGATVVLKPGQQAVLSSSQLQVQPVDVEEAIAWKNGYFQFNRSDLESLMRQVSRWYNVKVQYAGKIPLKEYTGKIPRHVSTEKLIEMLNYSGIKCQLQESGIVVNP